MKEKCFKLDYRNVAGFWARLALRCFRVPLEAMLGLGRLNDIHRRAIAIAGDGVFAESVLKAMRVTVSVNAEDLQRVPREGAVVVVANHPFGGIEGVVLLAQLKKLRPDVKAMANYMLAAIPEMRDDFFFVDPFGGAGAARGNIHAMRECRKWLDEGRLLIVFPAGEVAHYSFKARRIIESEWKRNVGALISGSKATCVPIWFKGCNGALFQLAGFIHPWARTLALPRQFANKCGKTIAFSVGRAITPEVFARLLRRGIDGVRYLRFRAEALRFRGIASSRHVPCCSAPVAPGVPAETIAAELEALPESCVVLREGGFAVFVVESAAIPQTMQELGRLRELCFRAVGEGTGKERDLDEFDGVYRQLLLWDTERRCIAGAYRMGLIDELIAEAKGGIGKFYSATLFKVDRHRFAGLPKGIELGRSFVSMEYQRNSSALFLLWRGIAAFVAANCKYRLLFGPVSVSNDYSPASRAIIAGVLSAKFKSPIADGVFSARHAPPVPKALKRFIAEQGEFFEDWTNLNELVREFEADDKGLPVLLRQYLGLQGRFAAFNVDADFSDALDGLVVVDLPNAGEKMLRRYMGADGAASYRMHHAGG